ncbi:Flp pilus assembly protein CpaB [Qipengyuania sediminis]|uniref:Flp pilus assembly protein CpaB n=1 Tax=Qipengyuania sediminis TaxID=1532023 RepID=UPI00105A84F6|nr:Flp pilus assembly protein CpaB [Qipengyuania sediminis]
MDRKKLVLLVSALIVAIGTAFVARSLFAGAAAPEAQAAVAAAPTGPKVLVAQRALSPGTIITPDALSFQPWPTDMVKDAYFIEGEADMQKLIGTVVRFAVTAGEPVTQGALVSPQDRGFLAAALTPGMRAITVPVSSQTGVAGFIFPGDRVDMMLTQSVGGEGGALQVAETVLRNLRVLATDQATTQEIVDGKAVPKVSGTVTLEVTPRIAEKVTVAQTLGSISFSLRPLADSHTELERAIASGDIKLPDNATPEQEEKLLKAVMAQPSDGKTSYVTGGDVSRFQRSTVPPAAAPAAAAGPVPVSAAAPAAPKGPTIKVRRGSNVAEEPVNGRRGA